MSTPQQPIRRRASAKHAPDTTTQDSYVTTYTIADDDSFYDTRLPNSTRRYTTDRQTSQAVAKQRPRDVIRFEGAYSQRRPASQRSRPAPAPHSREDEQKPRVHWLLFVGLALLAMVIGWIIFTNVFSWWQTSQDDWHYGRPRTFQIDAVVGHADSASSPSHFIALNLRRHVEVIECPGGDCSKAKVYVGPVLIGQGEDLAPVTLSFKDVNGDGKPDLIVTVQDSRFVFINDNGVFRQQRPNEPVQL